MGCFFSQGHFLRTNFQSVHSLPQAHPQQENVGKMHVLSLGCLVPQALPLTMPQLDSMPLPCSLGLFPITFPCRRGCLAMKETGQLLSLRAYCYLFSHPTIWFVSEVVRPSAPPSPLGCLYPHKVVHVCPCMHVHKGSWWWGLPVSILQVWFTAMLQSSAMDFNAPGSCSCYHSGCTLEVVANLPFKCLSEKRDRLVMSFTYPLISSSHLSGKSQSNALRKSPYYLLPNFGYCLNCLFKNPPNMNMLP